MGGTEILQYCNTLGSKLRCRARHRAATGSATQAFTSDIPVPSGEGGLAGLLAFLAAARQQRSGCQMRVLIEPFATSYLNRGRGWPDVYGAAGFRAGLEFDQQRHAENGCR